MPRPASGTQVELLERGRWTRAYDVVALSGRTPQHMVLRNPANGETFDHYWDELGASNRVVAG